MSAPPDYWPWGFAGAVLWFVIKHNRIADPASLAVMLGSTPTIAPYAVQYLTPLLARTLCMRSVRTQRTAAIPWAIDVRHDRLVSGALLNFLLAPLFIFVLHLEFFVPAHNAICQTVSLHDSDHNEPQIRR